MITDQQIMDLLHSAFVSGDRDKAANDTLLGCVGRIDSDVDGRILMLGGGNGNAFHAVPLDLDVLRAGIVALATERV